MTRQEHYRRARELMAELDPRVRTDRHQPVMTEVDRERLALASVHATLAAADAVVAEEYPERRVLASGGDVVVPVAEVKRALMELADQDSVESTRSAAAMVWDSLFGEVMP